MRAGRSRRWSAALAAVMLAALAACSGGTDEPGPTPTPGPDGLVLGIIQLIPDEGSRRAMLRVENGGADDLEVSRVGLDWAGYGEAFLREQDATVPAGSTLDLRFDLAAPACSDEAAGAPAYGLLETSAGVVRLPLKEISQDYLRRLWRTQCDEVLVTSTVDVAVADTWRQRGRGRDATADGTLVLTRVADGREVQVRRATGSVLYDLAVPPATLGPDDPALELPVRVGSAGRCDEHARGQATAPFDFELWLRVDDRPVTVPFPVPARASNAAQTMLDRVCGPIRTADQT